MNERTFPKGRVYLSTKIESYYAIIRSDQRPILVRQLEQDLEKLGKFDELESSISEDWKPECIKKRRLLSRAAKRHAVTTNCNMFISKEEKLQSTEESYDALRVAIANTTRHGVYFAETMLLGQDKKRLYRFCSDFCYLWTFDELREYCTAAGLLACGTKVGIIRFYSLSIS
eukprot:jgi/Galph1/566/GphlegSOOS_G5337.1